MMLYIFRNSVIRADSNQMLYKISRGSEDRNIGKERAETLMWMTPKIQVVGHYVLYSLRQAKRSVYDIYISQKFIRSQTDPKENGSN